MRGVSRFIGRLNRIAKNTRTELASAVRDSVNDLAQRMTKRVIVLSKVNQQDAPGNKPVTLAARNPVRKRIRPLVGMVELQSHWTKARTRVLVRVFASLGGLNRLVRRGLVIRRKLLSGARQNPQYVSFRSTWLLAWARRVDRGYQEKRHAVRLDGTALGKRVRRILVLLPALKAVREPTRKRFIQAVRKATK